MFGWMKKDNFKDIFLKAKSENIPQHTPDLAVLEQNKTIPLFDASEDNSKLFGWKKICPAVTFEHMGLWRMASEPGTPPLALNRRGLPCPRARILGNIYEVKVDDVIHLDKQRQNGVLFKRKAIPLITPFTEPYPDQGIDIFDREGILQIKMSQTYIGLRSEWSKRIWWDHDFHHGCGDYQLATVQEIHHPWIGRYFEHTPTKQIAAFRKCFIRKERFTKEECPVT